MGNVGGWISYIFRNGRETSGVRGNKVWNLLEVGCTDNMNKGFLDWFGFVVAVVLPSHTHCRLFNKNAGLHSKILHLKNVLHFFGSLQCDVQILE